MSGETTHLAARLDRQGRILSADAELLDWQDSCGGRPDGLLALPAMLALARKSASLGMSLTRPVHVAVEEARLLCWTRATPAGEGIDLVVERVTPLPRPLEEKTPLLAGDDDYLSIQLDTAMRILNSSGPGRTTADLPIGGALLDNLDLVGGEREHSRFIEAVTERQPLRNFRVRMRAEEAEYPLSGQPLLDRALGRFAGYRIVLNRPDGQEQEIAAPVAVPVAQEVPAMPARFFGEQLVPALRQPLDRIIANAETIGERMKGPLRSEYADYARDIADAGRHLLSLVGDLSDLEVVEAEGFTASADAIDLVDLGHRAAGLLAVKASDHSIRFQLDKPGESVPATGEFRRVLQILVNLIGNAINYAPDGSTITVTAERNGAQALISVSDEGQGVPEEDRARIFDKFERLGRSGDGGSGLGLYISKRLAHAMTGDLTVGEAPGGGACFTLRLPARADD